MRHITQTRAGGVDADVTAALTPHRTLLCEADLLVEHRLRDYCRHVEERVAHAHEGTGEISLLSFARHSCHGLDW